MEFDREAMRGVGKVTGFGLTLGLSMLLFGAAGIWIDRHLGTTPIITVIMFLLGGAGGMAYGIITFLK